jgi:hypothetical protein
MKRTLLSKALLCAILPVSILSAKTAVVAQSIEEEKLFRVYRRLSTAAGREGVRNDAVLIAWLHSSSSPMAKNILVKLSGGAPQRRVAPKRSCSSGMCSLR